MAISEQLDIQLKKSDLQTLITIWSNSKKALIAITLLWIFEKNWFVESSLLKVR